MSLRFAFFLVASSLCIGEARATVHTVGADAACTFSNLQAAVDMAATHAGYGTIHIANNLTYMGQAIAFTTNLPVELVGGFTDCSQADSNGSHTTIDGSGGDTAPVFSITINGGGYVKLSYLTIQGGDEDGDGKGGGIYFKGSGTLELNHCTLTNNVAGSGGGIYAQGTDLSANLVIGEDVVIVGNTARYDGGGIVDDSVRMKMIEPDSYIASNHAPGVLSADGQYVGGRGGGLLVLGGSRTADATIGSSGLGDLGTIFFNDARRGGGVAVLGKDSLNNWAKLTLFSTDLARPMRVRSNTAREYGGGVSLGTASSSDGYSGLDAEYVYFEDNIAPHGAAIDARGTRDFDISFNNGYLPGSVGCPTGKPCSGFIDNAAIDEAAQPVGGVIEIDSPIRVWLDYLTIEGNTGGSVFRGTGSPDYFSDSIAITDNTVSGSLLDGDSIALYDATIAGNSIGDDTVLRMSGSEDHPSYLADSIIWQPGKTTVHLHGGSSLDFHDLMVSERDSIDGGNTPYVVVQNPRFVDPERGDYSLRAGSPAVDRTFDDCVGGVDLYLNRRDVDLPIAANLGLCDLGSIERQYLQPLVLNSDFDADLRLWSTATEGVTTWDPSKNVTGAEGSGSAHISRPDAATGTRTGGIVECVHLPGPAVYALNGWGRGTGTMVAVGDIAELYWEYRKSGGESCTGGPPDASGTLTLSSTPNWSRAAAPAYINVPEQDWTYTSSIAVTLVAQENGPSGAPTNAWFDGITLATETIFESGFNH
jgi:predicted outer membrane repeat protein